MPLLELAPGRRTRRRARARDCPDRAWRGAPSGAEAARLVRAAADRRARSGSGADAGSAWLRAGSRASSLELPAAWVECSLRGGTPSRAPPIGWPLYNSSSRTTGETGRRLRERGAKGKCREAPAGEVDRPGCCMPYSRPKGATTTSSPNAAIDRNGTSEETECSVEQVVCSGVGGAVDVRCRAGCGGAADRQGRGDLSPERQRGKRRRLLEGGHRAGRRPRQQRQSRT